jgi:hypothetical protein
MQPVSLNEILKRLENIQSGEKLRLRTGQTFGEFMVIMELNPAWPKKHEKKYLLWVGKTEAAACAGKPFYQSDKAKKIANWPAERWCQWVAEETTPQKAA